jgi:hydrogenase assembly chaperone HypC/HupF
MCLSIPVKILELKKNNKAIADFGPAKNGVNKKEEVDTQLVEDIKIGDFALISNGFIIKKIPPNEAEEIFKEVKK